MSAVRQIGQHQIVCVSDGYLTSPLEAVRGIESDAIKTLAKLTGQGELSIPVNNFLLKRKDAVILVDAGAGNTMQPTLGQLGRNLAAAGISPSEVTHVVLTHIHPDHANGLINDEGEAVFPNAAIVVHETEINFWLRPADRPEPENVARNRRRAGLNLAPYKERIISVKSGAGLLGLSPMLAPGHTPGHTLWFDESGADRFVAWGDLVHLAAVQIPHPEVSVIYDIDPATATVSRKRVFDMLANERIGIIGAHLDSPGLGYLVRRGMAYAMEPI